MFSQILDKVKKVMTATKRIVRYNSFEISDNEDSQQRADLKSVLFELQQFFPPQVVDFTDIDRLVDEAKACHDEDGELQEVTLYREPYIANMRKDLRCLEILKNIRSLMEEMGKNAEVINWDLLIKEGFKVQCYQSFVYMMMKLIEFNPSDKINRDIAFNAGRTYICLLGIPGAKRCLIFDVELVITFFKLFTFNHQLTNNLGFSDYDDHYLELQTLQMLNECKKAFNVVCLSDQEEVLEKYIEALSSTLEHFMISSKKSSHEIITNCYENLEALCLKPLPDKKIENYMYLMFCQTVELHFLTCKRAGQVGRGAKHGEPISDFFIYLLTNYPEKMKNVLMKFVKSLLSNLEHKFERGKFQKLLDVAVKYELAMYWKTQESLVDYLQTLSLAADPRHRLNGVEFCGKMLLFDSTPDQTEQSTSQQIPREAFIIKILFEKVCDKQDNVKLKALTGLKAAIINGNEYCKKIFNIIFKQKSADNSPEIENILGEETEKFQNNLMSLLQNSPSTYIRKASLEILAQHCDNLLENEIFIETITNLTDDPSYLVKVQLIELVNSLLTTHSKTRSVLEMWLDVVLNLTKDNDTKIVDAAVKSSMGIFQKIESFENTVNDMQLLPWNIIRLVMSKGKRGLLQSAMSAATSNFLSQDKLRKIETHIVTPNKTEAWCLLSIVAKRMKSNNPDIVVKTFLDHIERFDDPSFDSSDLHLIIEVIQNWTTLFNSNSQTQIATKLSHALQSGNCSFSMIHQLYEICISTRTLVYGKEESSKFIKNLNEISMKNILAKYSDFTSDLNTERFICYLFIFCETNTDLPERPDRRIVDFMLKVVRDVSSEKLKVTVEFDIPRKLNCCIILLTRLAVRDNELASEVTPVLAKLLSMKSMHQVSVIKTTIKCLNDLCKKHTSTVAPVFKEIIYKLHSSDEEIRLCALENIYDLVMQDFIKMKGRVLLNFLACLVDSNEEIQMRSQAAILSYTNDKNSNLLYTCFLESVFIFNNFIQADSLGVFPLDEIDQNMNLLFGAEKCELRHELYLFFVQNIHDLNEVHLLMLLKQIVVIKEKLEKKSFKKNVNGVDTFKDLLLIFKMICDKRGESKIAVSRGENAEYEENNEDAEETTQPSAAATAKGGRKNKNAMTVNDALPVIEKMISVYPAFVSLMQNYDKSLLSGIKELTKSIVLNFPTFLEFSKPESFWHQAQDTAKPNNKKQRAKKRSAMKAFESSDSE